MLYQNVASIAAAALVADSLAHAAAAPVVVELNKLGQREHACRAYLVIDNRCGQAFDADALELALFNKSDVMATRFTARTRGLRADKTTVRAFGLPGVTCAGIGHVPLDRLRA